MYFARFFVVFVVILILYAVLIINHAPSWMNVPEHQWHRNMIKAENYLFDINADTVIIGSSLSNRINLSSFENSWYNLALDGQSIYDGLEIISSKTVLPRVLLIEINVLDRPKNGYFLETLLNPIKQSANQYIPIFNTTSRPSSWLREYLEFQLVRPVLSVFKPRKSNHNKKQNEIRKHLIDQTTLAFNQTINDEDILAYCQLLRSRISDYPKSTKVIFFEIPTNPALCDLPKPSQIRRAIMSEFPRVTFIPSPPCDNFDTTDAVHLDLESGTRFANYLSQKIK